MRRLMFLCVVLSACSTSIDVGDTPAQVTQIGPVELVGTELRIHYALRDYEGDDAQIVVEVCEEDVCGVAFEGTGSDGTQRVPTVLADTDVPHVFVWNLGCGILVGTELVAVDAEAEYVVRITPEGGEPAESHVFKLADLGLPAMFAMECNLR